MSAKYKINSNDLGEYLSILARYADVPHDDDEKFRELLRSYAELKFRIMGGSHCAMCRAHVRHVVPVILESEDGEIMQYTCLCTRCFEGEKAVAAKVFLEIGGNRMEVKLKHREPKAHRTAAGATRKTQA